VSTLVPTRVVIRAKHAKISGFNRAPREQEQGSKGINHGYLFA
jgi:hypothetical protein